MVRIIKSPLGEATGKMGDIVYRQMNGKTFASLRPDKYKATKSAKLKTARKNFARTIEFAREINLIPELKEVWHNAKLTGRLPFNRIVKSNRAFTLNGSLTKRNIITPEGLFFDVTSFAIQNKNLNISFNLSADYNLKFPLNLFIFFYFDKEKKSVFNQVTKIEEAVPGGNYSLTLTLNSDIKKVLTKDPAPLIYLGLSGLSVKKKFYWTSTSVFEI